MIQVKPRLIIKSWSVSNSPDAEGNLVNITARPPGLGAWIMDLIGIGVTSQITASPGFVTLTGASLMGRSSTAFATKRVSGVVWGDSRPAWAIPLIPLCGLGLLFLFFYKSLKIGFTVSNTEYSLHLAEGSVDGVKIDGAEIARAAGVIQATMS